MSEKVCACEVDCSCAFEFKGKIYTPLTSCSPRAIKATPVEKGSDGCYYCDPKAKLSDDVSIPDDCQVGIVGKVSF